MIPEPAASAASRLLSRPAGAWRWLALVALLSSVARPAAAQQGGSGGGGGTGGGPGSGAGGSSMTGAGGSSSLDEPGALCTPNPHEECPERCPLFNSCFVTGRMGQSDYLYYRVADQRFDCDGLTCEDASLELGDYCCERGKFAPRDDGGGCTLPFSGANDAGAGAWLGAGLGALAVARYRRRRRAG